MQMRPIWRAAAVALSAATVLGGTSLAAAATGQPGHGGGGHRGIQHVLLISVDGLHQQDLTWYVKNYPDSMLAALDRRGVEYSNAETPFPSDSTPGMTAQVTGGNPRSTGFYYDDTWNHDVFPAGTTKCTGPVPGAEAAYMEAIDKDSNALDAGQGGLIRTGPSSTRSMRRGRLRTRARVTWSFSPRTTTGCCCG